MRRVALVGKGIGRSLAPDKGAVWGINDTFVQQYCTMAFEMHDFTWSFEESLAHQRHYAGMYREEPKLVSQVKNRFVAWKYMTAEINKQKLPFMSLKKYRHIPTSRRFPIEKVIEELGYDFFTCGISYMVAYAIYVGKFDAIDCFGMNMEQDTEWMHQRPAVNFWLGYAAGRGMEVTVNGTLDRPLKCKDNKLYGFSMEQQQPRHLTNINIDGVIKHKVECELYKPDKEEYHETRHIKGKRILMTKKVDSAQHHTLLES